MDDVLHIRNVKTTSSNISCKEDTAERAKVERTELLHKAENAPFTRETDQAL